ncbi:MAG TPA: hypothetical protein VGR27_11030 [Longimicrobiaceae bacterium]|nr:hypothetical protein [Longimicrobiaceae bacterium]
MAEVLVQFETILPGPDGRSYVPRACGSLQEAGGLWEGWIEFVPSDGSAVLRTPQETQQSDRDDLLYWATGLTNVYLEGALERALDVALPPSDVAALAPTHDQPAPERVATPAAVPPVARTRAVLDPFDVHRQGESVLQQELSALDAAHLRDIIRAHRLVDEETVDLQGMSRLALAELIVAAVRKRAE